MYFNPPAPCGTGRRASRNWDSAPIFQSTRPLRDGTMWAGLLTITLFIFQSTRPLRDGTDMDSALRHFCQFQSTRPLRDGTDIRAWQLSEEVISIHPPLAGRDLIPGGQVSTRSNFNPPAPCGTGRSHKSAFVKDLHISIHPPLAGRDIEEELDDGSGTYFNPPAPCGTGRASLRLFRTLSVFQSTRPLRDGTDPAFQVYKWLCISIHPPLAGRDYISFLWRFAKSISIHPPLAGRDSKK